MNGTVTKKLTSKLILINVTVLFLIIATVLSRPGVFDHLTLTPMTWLLGFGIPIVSFLIAWIFSASLAAKNRSSFEPQVAALVLNVFLLLMYQI